MYGPMILSLIGYTAAEPQAGPILNEDGLEEDKILWRWRDWIEYVDLGRAMHGDMEYQKRYLEWQTYLEYRLDRTTRRYHQKRKDMRVCVCECKDINNHHAIGG